MAEAAARPTTTVGVGASAGGLKALKRFFATVPGNTGLVYVVVVHLSPEQPSHLADLLQPACQMPVVQVTATTLMEPDRVYVIPPGRNLSTIDTHLRLSELEEMRRQRAPIDHFFDTLSLTHHEHAIAVILSGTGSDGTLGIKKIKERGGLTIVQDPAEAEFDGMPQNAIATQLIDLILPVESMMDYILRFAKALPHVPTPEGGEELSEQDQQILQKIFSQLRAQTGQDFSTYKRSTVLRRLRRRMQLHQKERLEDYLALLRESPAEVRLLGDDFLITVTQFFRDPDSFGYLEKTVIPALFEGKGNGDRVRVWSVGCATGEEAYSLAILLLERAANCSGGPPELQVFASDLHELSLQHAREGRYPDTIAADVSPQRLKRFFIKEDSSYRIRKEVREIVVFASHNLLRDPPFSHMDLIVCSNVLIYLQRGPQHEVIDLFHYALNPEGFLVLGNSGTVDRAGLFKVDNKRFSVYRRRNVPPPAPRLPAFFQPLRRGRDSTPMLDRRYHAPATSYGTLHQRIVERYALPSLLLNEENQVVHLSEHAGRYLQVSGGDLSPNVFKLAREELRLELRAALQAAAAGRDIRTKAVPITLDGKPTHVIMHVRPSKSDDVEGLYLVIFDELEEVEVEAAAATGTLPLSADERQELESLRTQWREVIEQYESGREEMKAANEELQSTNEELRSAMEELETGKEELQSMNEELQTVNQENRHRVEELSQLTADLNSLIAATEIATLFLDQQLRILRVTPPVADLFNVRSSDLGRPLTDFSNHLGYSQLAEDAQRVLERLVPVEREVLSQEGKWYLMRILPYRAGDVIKGVVITCLEITHRKHMELALRESEESFRALITASAQIVWRMDAEGMIVEDSPSWRAFTGQGYHQLQGAGWLEAFHPDERERARAAWRAAIKAQRPLDEELRLLHREGGSRWTHVRAIPLHNDIGELRGWVGMIIDISHRKAAEQALKEADHRKDQFLATLGHELRNPLAPLRTALELLRKQMPSDPKLQQLRDILDRQVRHLTRLVDDLLDVSRIKSGRIRLQLQRVDVREVVDEAVAGLKAAAEERWHRVTVQQWEEPLIIEGDPLRLKQIVTNLADNAIKYTPDGGHMAVTTRRHGRAVEISVKDDGLGILPKELGGIFEAFGRAQPTGPSAGGGLGLGLTLVRQLTQLHGGTVEAYSEGPGHGSEFIVRLPLTVERRSAAGHPADGAPAAGVPDAQEHKQVAASKRVLIVDDNKDGADALKLMVESAGYQVQQVYDGKSALKTASSFEPDAVLLDIGLPDISGYDLAREFSCRAPRPLIIAISGFVEDKQRIDSAPRIIDHYLVKPAAPAVVLKLLEKAKAQTRTANA